MDLTYTAVANIRAKQADRIFRALPAATLGGLAALVLSIAVTWGQLDPMALAAAHGALALLYLVGGVLGLAYAKANPGDAKVKYWWSTLTGLFALTGAAWGVIAALTELSGGATAGIAIVVVIVAMLTTARFASAQVACGCFCAAALLPLAAGLLATGERDGVASAGAVIAALAGLLYLGRFIQRQALDLILLRNENQQMTGHLDQRRTQVEKLNVALKTNQDKREQAEGTLRRTLADLGLVQGKARALATTLERVSPMCPVTGLANRRHLDEHLGAEWRRSIREGRHVSTVIVDLDDYEEYVENYGRQSSDTLLKRLGTVVKGFGRRAGDLAGRYDDSKLALVLSGCDARNAARIAEALRRRVEQLKIPHAAAKNSEQATAHVGVATMKPSKLIAPTELLKRVDAALYEARFQGGNKVVPYKPLSRLRLERWDPPSDGPLNEQSLMQKLLVWGYDTKKIKLPGDGESMEHVSDDDAVIALLSGKLNVDIEGHTMRVVPGDAVFVPHGLLTAFVNDAPNPAVLISAIKSK